MGARSRATALAAAVLLASVVLIGVVPALSETRLDAARKVAVWRWGDVCGGQVSIFNRPLKDYIAIAVSDRGPRGRRNCAVTYSTTYSWSWWSLCRATVHEWGHLAGWKARPGHEYVWRERGRPPRSDFTHSRNPLAVMFPYTIEPWSPCGPDHNHPRFGGRR